MKVVIIGSGNVATVLGKKMVAAGHDVIEVISRSLQNAQVLASQLNAKSSDKIESAYTDADIYLVCVSDNLIKNISEQIADTNKILVHTAGAVSKNVFNDKTRYGVLYPLQSLRKEMEHLPEIPVLVDGNTEKIKQTIFDFALSWASSASFANDEERLKLHVAAVFASNFTNHLYALAEDFCRSEKVEFKQLLPLINETCNRLNIASPSTLQTGPAVRNDISTIDKHLQILSAYPHLTNIYNSLTDSIIALHKTKSGS